MPIPDLNEKRILVLRTDRLGDVILSTPVAVALKQTFPKSKLTFLVRTYTRPVVESCPQVDDILILDDFVDSTGRVRSVQLARYLQSQHFDVALHLFPVPSLALATWLARIPFRVGTGFRFYSFLFNRRLYEHRKTARFHEAEYNLHLLRLLGIQNPVVQFSFQVDEAARRSLERKLSSATSEHPADLVVIHPGSGGSSRDWPPAHYAQLADRIMQDLNIPVILTGDQNDRGVIQEMKSQMQAKPIDLSSRLTLKELAALLQRATLVVSNSTGPLHLAVALGTDVLAFYPPIRECHPQRWGPYGRQHDVLMSRTEECFRCRADSNRWCECMQRISVALAYDKVSEKLTYKLNRKYHSG